MEHDITLLVALLNRIFDENFDATVRGIAFLFGMEQMPSNEMSSTKILQAVLETAIAQDGIKKTMDALADFIVMEIENTTLVSPTM